MAQPIMAFLQEEFKMTRKIAAWIVGAMTFFFTLPVIFFLKHGFLNEIDFWIGTFGLVVFAILEVVLFIWVFGTANAWTEINSGADIRLPRFVLPIMKYVTLAYLLVLMVFWFIQDGWNVMMMKGVAAADYPYVWFARFMLIGIGAFMVFLVYIAWRKKRVIQQRVPD
jgi:SNF family Na+-dependent transporter